MNKIFKLLSFLSIAILITGLQAFAQKVTVLYDSFEADQIKRQGLFIDLELPRKNLEKAWQRKLKEIGKLETSRSGTLTIRGALNPTFSPGSFNLYSKIDNLPLGCRIFLAVDRGTEFVKPESEGFEEIRRWMYEFGIQQYRDDINLQIAELEKSIDVSVRTHEKQQDEGSSIKRGLEKNISEKSRLLRLLKENEVERYKLKADSTQNSIDQASSLEEISRLRKVMEDKRFKLSQVQ